MWRTSGRSDTARCSQGYASVTLRVVSDNTNVAEFPPRGIQNIGDLARGLGEEFDEGKWADVRAVITIVVTESGMVILPWGDNPNGYEMMGIFEAVKLRVFADDMVDD